MNRFAFHKSFLKKYKKHTLKLQKQTDLRISLFIEDSRNPILEHHELSGKYKGYWSINITGDYRALYYPKNKIAIFVDLDTHSNLYS